MTTQLTRKIARLIREAATKLAKDPGPIPPDMTRPFRMVGRFSLAGRALECVTEAESLVARQGDNRRKFTEKFVQKRTWKVVEQEIVEPSSDAELAGSIDRLLSELQSYDKPTTVITLLGGISLGAEECEIGGLRLVTLTDQLIDEITRADSTSLGQQELADAQGQVAALYEVVAEPSRAAERALREVGRVLDLLRFTVPALERYPDRVELGLWHEVQATSRTLYMLHDRGVAASWSRIGPITTFHLDEARLDAAEEVGFSAVSELLRRSAGGERLTKFEETVLRAIYWFARSVDDAAPEHKLLSLITALETFFTPESGAPISVAVAEGAALTITRDPDQRLRIYNRVKELHGKRSGLSHGGNETVEPQDLVDLTYIALDVISRLISMSSRFGSRPDVRDWLVRLKLGHSDHADGDPVTS